MNPLTIISYNVKGLNSPIKKKKILLQLKHFKCQVAFLQETHLSDDEHLKLKKILGRQSLLLIPLFWEKKRGGDTDT